MVNCIKIKKILKPSLLLYTFFKTPLKKSNLKARTPLKKSNLKARTPLKKSIME